MGCPLQLLRDHEVNEGIVHLSKVSGVSLKQTQFDISTHVLHDISINDYLSWEVRDLFSHASPSCPINSRFINVSLLINCCIWLSYLHKFETTESVIGTPDLVKKIYQSDIGDIVE